MQAGVQYLKPAQRRKLSIGAAASARQPTTSLRSPTYPVVCQCQGYTRATERKEKQKEGLTCEEEVATQPAAQYSWRDRSRREVVGCRGECRLRRRSPLHPPSSQLRSTDVAGGAQQRAPAAASTHSYSSSRVRMLLLQCSPIQLRGEACRGPVVDRRRADGRRSRAAGRGKGVHCLLRMGQSKWHQRGGTSSHINRVLKF
jgi:hypothetical protein